MAPENGSENKQKIGKADEPEHTYKIGKNVIETLTSGMYADSMYIFREYIQNAADQIDVAVEERILKSKDDGIIEITIDSDNRKIAIRDNATGIRENSVLRFLGDVANSAKDREKRKGFRGIGRLGGLGYCDKLIFETSYSGEPKASIVTLDAKTLKRLIQNKDVTLDAAEIIGVITSIEKKDAESDEHFFQVTLEQVSDDELLDQEKVRTYLSMVAPVPFYPEPTPENEKEIPKFTFAKKIRKFFEKNNFKIDEYHVINTTLNDKPIYKGYQNAIFDKEGNVISELIDIEGFTIKDSKKELLAIGWYGISDHLNKMMSVKNIDRAFRIRKDNITIGDQHTLTKFFKEDRFNYYFKGEIYVIGSSFMPNGRRDYFNDDENKTVKEFEKELAKKFDEFCKLARYTSTIQSQYSKIDKYNEAIEEVKEKKENSGWTRVELNELKENAIKAFNNLEKVKQKIDENIPALKVYDNIVDESKFDILSDSSASVSINQVKSSNMFISLPEKEREIVLIIYEVIEENLPQKQAKQLRIKIVERLEEEYGR